MFALNSTAGIKVDLFGPRNDNNILWRQDLLLSEVCVSMASVVIRIYLICECFIV